LLLKGCRASSAGFKQTCLVTQKTLAPQISHFWKRSLSCHAAVGSGCERTTPFTAFTLATPTAVTQRRCLQGLRWVWAV